MQGHVRHGLEHAARGQFMLEQAQPMQFFPEQGGIDSPFGAGNSTSDTTHLTARRRSSSRSLSMGQPVDRASLGEVQHFRV